MRRRDFIHCSLCASGAWLLGCDTSAPADAGRSDSGADGGPSIRPVDAGPTCGDPFADGTLLGVLPFVDEDVPFGVRRGAGLDGRLYADLSQIQSDAVIGNDLFYLRTFYPDRLVPPDPWTITIDGLTTPRTLTIDEIEALTEPQGVHVLECSGNSRGGGFGLMSAASWAGAPTRALFDTLDIDPSATRVLIEGFDMHSTPSTGGHSTPGASWVFTFDDLDRAGAFLATQMNGVALPNDHGAPVRLYVPGWYGCACIKWVNAIRFVDDDESATSQMLEFSTRTHQLGTPTLARDFIPASMDQAAMPIRVEKWRTSSGEILHRVVGILFGGQTLTERLLMVASGLDPVSVDICPVMTTNQTWTVWQSVWRPDFVGEHPIHMQIDDDAIPTRRLDTRYYQRRVVVDEV